jgi:hypothetical protein
MGPSLLRRWGKATGGWMLEGWMLEGWMLEGWMLDVAC